MLVAFTPWHLPHFRSWRTNAIDCFCTMSINWLSMKSMSYSLLHSKLAHLQHAGLFPSAGVMKGSLHRSRSRHELQDRQITSGSTNEEQGSLNVASEENSPTPRSLNKSRLSLFTWCCVLESSDNTLQINFTNSKAGLFRGRWDPGRRGNSTLGSVFEDRSPDKVCCIFCVTENKVCVSSPEILSWANVTKLGVADVSATLCDWELVLFLMGVFPGSIRRLSSKEWV